MKKFISLLICFLFLATATPCVFAAEAEPETMNLPDGKLYPAYAISSSDTYSYRTAKKAIIPENILSIDDETFAQCTELEDITILGNLQHIGFSAFDDTAYYKNPENWEDGVLYIGSCLIKADPEVITDSYTVREGTTLIANGAFNDCESLSTIIIPDSVKYTGAAAFAKTAFYNNPENWEDGMLYLGNILLSASENCPENLIIKDSVTSIADNAFEFSDIITSVTIPDSVTHIGEEAFSNCARLSEVHLGKGVRTLGKDCFNWCLAISQITVATGNRDFAVRDSILYNKDITKLVLCPTGLSGSVTLPETIREIMPSAFLGCTKLQSVVLPDNLLFIDEYAFSTMKLNSIKLPESLNYIGDFAFTYNTFITEITIPDRVTEMGAYAFADCPYLREVTLGENLYYIPAGCFAECKSLYKVNISSSIITYISGNAFENTALINDPSSYNYYGNLILSDSYLIRVAADVTKCYVPDNLICIANNAFLPPLEAGVLKEIHIPENTPYLHQNVFGAPLDDVKINYWGNTEDFDRRTNIDINTLNLHTDTSFSAQAWAFFLVVLFPVPALILSLINDYRIKKHKKEVKTYDSE